jgi:acyl-CoA synthetase (AMP-forming)/AMP-acid ligase II
VTSLRALLDDGDDGEPLVLADAGDTTRGELRADADRLANALRDRGLERRAVGVLAPNAPATISAWFGVWAAGATVAPLNPRVPPAELAKLAASTGISALVTVPDLRDLAAPLASAPIVESGGAHLAFAVDTATPRATTPDVAIVQFTSGTTGAPKPVPLYHERVSELLDGVIVSLRGARDGRARMPNLVPVSLSLWAGIYQVLFAFRIGAPVVLMERFEPATFARLVARYEIRSSVLPPAALVMLVQDDTITSLAPLRYVRSVSAPLSPVHARAFHERFGVAVLNGYGQTELGGEVVGWNAGDWKTFGAAKLGAVGRPHPGVQVRVRLDDGSLDPATGAVGELEIRAASRPPTDPALADRVSDDGWLRTGDLGRVDGDGFVWLEGRASAMINRGGLKVFPDEVEETIRADATVSDVAVAGVADARLGEVPWAFVVAAPGATVDVDGLEARCRAAMAPYKVPAGWTLVAELPRNEIGKVLRQDLVPLASRD